MTVYVGMDVHRKRSQIAVLDAAGEEQRNRNVANDPVKLVPILGVLPPGTPVAFEAAYGWGWLVEPTDLAVGGSNPSRRASKPAAQRPCKWDAEHCQIPRTATKLRPRWRPVLR